MKKNISTPLIDIIRLSAAALTVTSPYNDASFNGYHGGGDGSLDFGDDDEDSD